MSVNVGRLNVLLEARTARFDRSLSNVRKRLEAVDKRMERLANRARGLQEIGKRAAVATVGVVGLASGLVKLASDAEETRSKMRQVFGDLTNEVDAWALQTARDMGRSRQQMRTFVTDLEAIIGPMIGNRRESAKMSRTFAALAVDMGSFFNVADQEAMTALVSGLIGETEPMRRFGVILTETALEEFRLARGIQKSVREMTEAEKVQLRFALTMERLQAAQGDAIRTAGGFANTLRSLMGELRNAGEDIGNRFLPAATKVVGWARDAVQRFTELDDATKDQVARWIAIGGAVLGVVSTLAIFGTIALLAIKGIALLTGALGLLFSPTFLIVALLVGLFAAVKVAWEKDLGGIQGTVETWSDAVVAAFESVKAWWEDSALGQAVRNAFGRLKDIWGSEDLSLPEKLIETAPLAIGTALLSFGVFKLAAGAGALALRIGRFVWSKLALVGVTIAIAAATMEFADFILGTDVMPRFHERVREIWKDEEVSVPVKIILSAAAFLDAATETSANLRAAMGPLLEMSRQFARGALFSGGITVEDVIDPNTESGQIALALLELARSIGDFLVDAVASFIDFGVILLNVGFGLTANAVHTLVDFGKRIGEEIVNGVIDMLNLIPGLAIEHVDFTSSSAGEQIAGDISAAGGAVIISVTDPKATGHPSDIQGNALGTILPGFGGGDRIPALLEAGEAIVPAGVVRGGLGSIVQWFRSMGVQRLQGGAIPAGLATGIENAQGLADALKQSMEGVSRAILQGLTMLVQHLGQFLLQAVETIFGPEAAANLEAAFEALKQKAQELINSFGSTSESGDDAAKKLDDVTAATKTMPTLWERIIGRVKEFGQAVLDAIPKPIRDFAGQFGGQLGGKIMGAAPIAQSALQGAQQGAAGGPAGMAAGALVGLLQHSETFATLMELINPLLQALADAVGMVLKPILPLVHVLGVILTPIFTALGLILESLLLPIMPFLFEGLKFLGIIVLFVAEVFQRIRSIILEAVGGLVKGLGNFVDSIVPDWISHAGKGLARTGQNLINAGRAARKSADELAAARKKLSEMTWEDAQRAIENMGEAADSAGDALRNVPRIFKDALVRARVADPIPSAQTGGFVSQSGLVNVHAGEVITPVDEDDGGRRGGPTIIIKGDVFGWEDFKRKVRQAASEGDHEADMAFLGA